ncbi:MAG: hypothetical protein AAF517_25810, partial [Planctomycetota bacterium]
MSPQLGAHSYLTEKSSSTTTDRPNEPENRAGIRFSLPKDVGASGDFGRATDENFPARNRRIVAGLRLRGFAQHRLDRGAKLAYRPQSPC